MLAAVTGAAVGLGWWLWPRGSDAPAPAADAKPPVSQFQGVRLLDEDSDGTRWTLRATRGVGWESKGTGKLDEVEVLFERGGRKIVVTAGNGEISEAETVALAGGVLLVCDEFKAMLDRATYYRGKGEIRSDAAVELLGPSLRVQGKGLELDVEGKSARVLAEVKAVVGGQKK